MGTRIRLAGLGAPDIAGGRTPKAHSTGRSDGGGRDGVAFDLDAETAPQQAQTRTGTRAGSAGDARSDPVAPDGMKGWVGGVAVNLDGRRDRNEKTKIGSILNK